MLGVCSTGMLRFSWIIAMTSWCQIQVWFPLELHQSGGVMLSFFCKVSFALRKGGPSVTHPISMYLSINLGIKHDTIQHTIYLPPNFKHIYYITKSDLHIHTHISKSIPSQENSENIPSSAPFFEPPNPLIVYLFQDQLPVPAWTSWHHPWKNAPNGAARTRRFCFFFRSVGGGSSLQLISVATLDYIRCTFLCLQRSLRLSQCRGNNDYSNMFKTLLPSSEMFMDVPVYEQTTHQCQEYDGSLRNIKKPRFFHSFSASPSLKSKHLQPSQCFIPLLVQATDWYQERGMHIDLEASKLLPQRETILLLTRPFLCLRFA